MSVYFSAKDETKHSQSVQEENHCICICHISLPSDMHAYVHVYMYVYVWMQIWRLCILSHVNKFQNAVNGVGKVTLSREFGHRNHHLILDEVIEAKYIYRLN